MLREIALWYYDWGWIITCIIAFPLGYWSGAKGLGTVICFLFGLLILGLTMFAFKFF